MHYDWPVHRLTLLCFLTAAGGLAPAGCSSDGSNTGDCGVTHEEKTISTPEPAEDPGLQFKIDSCHADVDACPTLCALAMTRAGISFNSGQVFGPGEGDVATGAPPPLGGSPPSTVTPAIKCDVTFSNGNVEMVVRYDTFSTTLGCPIQVTNTFPPSGSGSGTTTPTTTPGGPK